MTRRPSGVGPSLFRLAVTVAATLGLALTGAVGVAVQPGNAAVQTPAAAAAANAGDFDPGNIISDTNFFDSGSMSAADIQAFLNARVTSCAAASMPCLKNYSVSVPQRSADAYCTAISGATRTAAEIIAVVAQACRISPRVLLVLLEKEQGLVSARTPSERQYRVATGYGCPDTAACDTKYYGFFNQLVSASWQFHHYATYPARFSYRAGQTNQILYHPNATCGRMSVYIANVATAGLYNYTPYTPNSAALANMYGTGDSCSSYGNRNFWRMYSDWFGSPTGGGRAAIDLAYAAAGGAAVLGAGVAYLDCPITAARCWPQYEHGSIFWSRGTGADIVLGAKDVAFRALRGPDGPLGYPITGEYTYIQNGGGSAQVFEKGSLFESAAGIFPSYGAVKTAYFTKNGAWGELGWPTSPTTCSGVNCWQIFQYGAIAVVGADVSFIGRVERDVWVATGGVTGALGGPTSTLFTYSHNGGGTARVYSGGSIFSSAAGAFAVTDPVRLAYFARQGAWGELGWPSSVMQCAPGGCWQSFQRGAILTSNTGTFALDATEYAALQAAGGPAGALGFPRSLIYSYPQNGGGTARLYANGSLFNSPAGAFAVMEPVRTAYFAQQAAQGELGWPMSAMTCASGTCTQEFQNGPLTVAGSAPTPPTSGISNEEMAVLVGRIGVIAANENLGTATSGLLFYSENGGGVARVFDSTTVFSSVAGAFSVTGALRTAYFAKQGAVGSLGWPTGARQCPSGGCWQRFQQGAVFTSPSGAYSLTTAEYEQYATAGGPGGALGFPASEVVTYTQNGGGTVRIFVRGSFFTSAAGGFAVTDPVRTAYFARQGAWGELGWPSSASFSSGSTVAQMFQYGAIAVVSGSPLYLGAAERDAWVNAGGPTGAIGLPASPPYTYVQNGGGIARVYTGGSIFTSPAGAVAVTDPIRSAYFARQGAWGDLGWPISAASTSGSASWQNFQNGAIVVSGGPHYLGVAERDAWLADGALTGRLGAPTGLYTYTENGGGTARTYVGGTIYMSAAGAFAVIEPIRTPYFAEMGAWGSYGWPTSGMSCASGTCTQQFQYGTISAAGS